MIIDARSLPDGTQFDADLCIIGAGAAGIALALEFATSRFRVAVVESGAMTMEPETQGLYAGTAIGRPYLDLTTCRLRFFGGTTNHWGGWCLPLDAADFEKREGFPYHGWPFGRSKLDPWYVRAQEVCRLGPFDYDPAHFGITPDKVPAPFKGPHFVNKVFQISKSVYTLYRENLDRAAAVSVYLHANAVNLAPSEDGGRIERLDLAMLSGVRATLRSRIYVLAAGGIENARIMLASGPPGKKGIGNERDLVGRFFMVHLQFAAGAIALGDPYVNLDFMTGFNTAKPWPFYSYVGLSDDAMRSLKLPNVRLMGDYKFAPVVLAVEAIKRLAGQEERTRPIMGDVMQVARDLGGLADFAYHKTFHGAGVPVEALILNCNIEQSPNPESRVLLGAERDALGMRKVALDWRLLRDDKLGINAIFRLLGAEIGRSGLGRLRYFLDEDDTTWPDDLRGDEHHMGTTRMHEDPAFGVVDPNCLVHGLANLYVAGSSVFPTGGATNPTLTIIALALRLADHLKERLA